MACLVRNLAHNSAGPAESATNGDPAGGGAEFFVPVPA